MAESSIVEKLRRALTEGMATEQQVVYLLVEIRKLLELRDEKETYFALYCYCCWALHTTMNRNGARKILERFDQASSRATFY